MRKSFRKEVMERSRKQKRSRKLVQAPENKLMTAPEENKSDDIIHPSYWPESTDTQLESSGCDDVSGSDDSSGSPSD